MDFVYAINMKFRPLGLEAGGTSPISTLQKGGALAGSEDVQCRCVMWFLFYFVRTSTVGVGGCAARFFLLLFFPVQQIASGVLATV